MQGARRLATMGSVVLGLLCATVHAAPIPGAPDTSFGTSGEAVIESAAVHLMPLAITLAPDNRVLIGGIAEPVHVQGDNESDLLIARLSADGCIDETFGSGGVVRTNIQNNEHVRSLVAYEDGRILAVGWTSHRDSNVDIVLVRYLADGTLDSSFGVNGIVVQAVGSGEDAALSVALLPSGKIVIAGNSQVGSQEALLIAQFKEDGSIDEAFGAGGVIKILVGSEQCFGAGVVGDKAVPGLHGERIIAAGSCTDGMRYEIIAAAITPDGLPDDTFGDHGVAHVALPNGSLSVQGVAIQKESGIVLAGLYHPVTDYTQMSMAVARIRPDGTLDLDFGDQGVVLFNSKGYGFARSVAVQGDAKVLVVGAITQSNDLRMAIGRTLPSGAIDTQFGALGNGLVIGEATEGTSVATVGADRVLWAGTAYRTLNPAVPDRIVVERSWLSGPSKELCGNGIVDIGEQCDNVSACCAECRRLSGAQCGPETLTVDSFDQRDLSRWSCVRGTGLSVTKDAALGGLRGIQIKARQGASFLQDSRPKDAIVYSATFLMDVSALGMNERTSVRLMDGYSFQGGRVVMKLRLLQRNGRRQLQLSCRASHGWVRPKVIRVPARVVNVSVERDASSCALTIDGKTQTVEFDGMNTDGVDYVRWGVIAMSEPGVSGRLAVDEFASVSGR